MDCIHAYYILPLHTKGVLLLVLPIPYLSFTKTIKPTIICAIFACGYWLLGKKLCKPHDSWQCIC